jgi:hypothetical protein
MEGDRAVRIVMVERCPDCTCEITEKLENMQVLRHIMMAKKKEYEGLKKGKCTVHDDKTRQKNTADGNKSG